MVTISDLDTLADWMVRRHVRRMKSGDMEIELLPSAFAPPPPAPMTKEQVEIDVRESRRRRYQLELGRRLSDEELSKLP